MAVSGEYTIQLMGNALGTSTNCDGQFVKEFDPDGNDGRGTLVVTDKQSAAIGFKDHHDALEYWRQQSTTHPYRDDNKPNRPLTAFNVVIERVDKTSGVGWPE